MCRPASHVQPVERPAYHSPEHIVRRRIVERSRHVIKDKPDCNVHHRCRADTSDERSLRQDVGGTAPDLADAGDRDILPMNEQRNCTFAKTLSSCMVMHWVRDVSRMISLTFPESFHVAFTRDA